MQRLKLLGLALITVFALGAAAASVASAESAGIMMLPDSNAGAAGMTFSFASTAGEKTFLETLAGTTVTCSSVSGTGTASSDPLGKVTFKFVGCEIAGLAKCTGLKRHDGREHHLRSRIPLPLLINRAEQRRADGDLT